MCKLSEIAKKIRLQIIEQSHTSGTPHLASCLSIVDALVAMYWGVLDCHPKKIKNPNRDKFILSKGHAALSLYTTLMHRGIIKKRDLASYAQQGSFLTEQPSPNVVPGVEWATGSLGHGLGVGLGMAVAAKKRGWDSKIAVLVGDGEINEGSVWEAAMMAPKLQSDNLICLVDYNKWQATGRTRDIMAVEPLRLKWEAFGWHVVEVDGHDIVKIVEEAKNSLRKSQPSLLILNTIKGKGISFMEDDNNWHYIVPSSEQVAMARKELCSEI